MSSTEPREHRQLCTRITETRNTWEYRQNFHSSTEPRESIRGTYLWQSKNQNNVVLYVLELSPAEEICPNSHSWDCLGVFGVEQWVWTLSTGCTDGRNILHTRRIPGYWAYWGYFGNASTRRSSTNTANGRNTARLVLAVPAVQNPELLEAQQHREYPRQQK